MRSIYLIRHNKTIAEDGGRRCIGLTDIPLDESVDGPSEMLGGWLRQRMGERPEAAWIASETLSRATDTAGYIMRGAGDVIFGELIADPEFNEVSTGLWENRTFEDIRMNEPEEYTKRGESLGYFRFPDGGRCMKRVFVLRKLLTAYEGLPIKT